MINSEIRWGIIGCGDVTEKKSGPAYQKTDGFSIVAAMRRDGAKAKDYAQRHGIPKWYDDADALISDPDVDAVYIATPPDTHSFYALKTAATGKPCCIEKPMAPAYVDCLTICEAFEKKNLPLFVAYYRRSLPRFLTVKQWIEDGKIGEVQRIHWKLTRTPSEVDLSRQYNWRTDAKIARGGYFDDLASHGLDLFIFLLGTISEVEGKASNRYGFYDAFDVITAEWKHGTIGGTGEWDFGAKKREDEVVIKGSTGKITFSVFGEVPLVLENDNDTRELFIEHPENVQLFHVENMREHLAGNAIHPSTGRTAAETTRVMDIILGKSVSAV